MVDAVDEMLCKRIFSSAAARPLINFMFDLHLTHVQLLAASQVVAWTALRPKIKNQQKKVKIEMKNFQFN